MSDALRRDVRELRRARVDILELEERLGAKVYDFHYLRYRAERDAAGRAALAVSKHTGQWSVALSVLALPHLLKADVVYASGEDVGFPLAWLLRIRGHALRPRLIIRLEQPTYGRTLVRRTLFNAYSQGALERASKVVCRTRAHAQYLSSVFGVPSDKLVFVQEVTDREFFTPELAGPLEGLDPRVRRPFIVSGGLEMRDYTTLIEAVRPLPINLVIGAGSPWAQVRFRWTEDRPLPDNVWISSFSPQQVRDLYRWAEFVVVPIRPTLRACGMNVILEAWAMQKAVLASRTTGLQDYLEDGKTARFVDSLDAIGMRAAIEELLNDAPQRHVLATGGRQRVMDDLNIERYVERIAELIQG